MGVQFGYEGDLGRSPPPPRQFHLQLSEVLVVPGQKKCVNPCVQLKACIPATAVAAIVKIPSLKTPRARTVVWHGGIW